jgi:hypothetical protein
MKTESKFKREEGDKNEIFKRIYSSNERLRIRIIGPKKLAG